MLEGFEESTLWDVLGPDVAQVGMETLTVIAGMHFSVVSPTKMTTWVDENARMAKKCIKNFSSLTIQSRIQTHLTKGPEPKELI